MYSIYLTTRTAQTVIASPNLVAVLTIAARISGGRVRVWSHTMKMFLV